MEATQIKSEEQNILNISFEFLKHNHKNQVKSLLEQNNVKLHDATFNHILQQDPQTQSSFYLNVFNQNKEIVSMGHFFYEMKYSRGGVIQMHITPVLFHKSNLAKTIQNSYKISQKSPEFLQYQQESEKYIRQQLLREIFKYKGESYKLTLQSQLDHCGDLQEIGFEFNPEIKKNDVFMTRYNKRARKNSFKAKL